MDLLNEVIGYDEETIICAPRNMVYTITRDLCDNGWNRIRKFNNEFTRDRQQLCIIPFERGPSALESRRVDHVIIIDRPPKYEWYPLADIIGRKVTRIG